MIKIIESVDDLKKEINEINKDIEIGQILRIDLPFIDSQEKFTIMNIPSYGGENHNNLIFVADKKVLIYTSVGTKKPEKKFEKIFNRKYGESTITMFMLLKSILKNYSHEFVRIRETMNALELDPMLDSIEETARQLRKLTDRMEGLFQIIIELKEEDISCFDISLINEYELFSTEAKYWLERSRSHTYRIASLRTKSEMRSNKELNDTMKKLTVIMTFLTIVSIVVNVPGTIGAIFGIPALSNAYFESHTTFLILTLIATTTLSVLLGFVYWKSLNLKQR